MTHLSDELLSAHIDGDELWSPDAAHLDECDECRARLDALRRVVAVVGTSTPPPAAHLREAAVAAAMVETTGVVPNIRRLVTRRERTAQSHTARRMSSASAAAALIVALGVGGWAISQLGNSSRDQNTSNAAAALNNDAVRTESATAADAANPAPERSSGLDSAGAAVASPGVYDAGEIGEFGDTEPIAALYRDYVARPEDERSKDGSFMAAPPCPTPADHSTVWHASLTYEGVEAWARVVTANPSSAQTLQVLRRSNCELVASQAI